MIDMAKTIEAYHYLEVLLSNGHNFRRLPITRDKVDAIIAFREVSDEDLRLLRQAVEVEQIGASDPIVQN